MKMQYLPSLYITLLVMTVLACRNDKNPPDKTLTEAVEMPERLPERDAVAVDTAYLLDDGDLNPRNVRWYTYQYDADGTTTPTYTITETSRPPLFHKNCLTAAQPEQCSNEAVLDWMQYAVERPQTPARPQGPMHFVQFLVNEVGKVYFMNIIPNKGQPACPPCEAATKEAIAGMPTWLPAIRTGRHVKVKVILPVYYN